MTPEMMVYDGNLDTETESQHSYALLFDANSYTPYSVRCFQCLVTCHPVCFCGATTIEESLQS